MKLWWQMSSGLGGGGGGAGAVAGDYCGGGGNKLSDRRAARLGLGDYRRRPLAIGRGLPAEPEFGAGFGSGAVAGAVAGAGLPLSPQPSFSLPPLPFSSQAPRRVPLAPPPPTLLMTAIEARATMAAMLLLPSM